MKPGILILGAFVFVTGCGRFEKAAKDQRDEDVLDAQNAAPTASSDDANDESEDFLLQLQDGANGGAEEATADESESASFGLLAVSGEGSRECVEELSDQSNPDSAKRAHVTIERSFERSINIPRRRGSFSREANGSESISRLWARESGDMLCEGNFAAFDIRDATGVSVDVEFKREWRADSSLTDRMRDREYQRSASWIAEGHRRIAWSESAVEGDKLQIAGSVESDVQRRASVERADGSKLEFEQTVKTGDGSPIMVELSRRNADLALLTKLIKSGSVHVKSSLREFEISYKDVKLNFAEGCVAESGALSIKKFKDDGSTKTYEVTIKDGLATVVNESGKIVGEFEFTAGCDRSE